MPRHPITGDDSPRELDESAQRVELLADEPVLSTEHWIPLQSGADETRRASSRSRLTPGSGAVPPPPGRPFAFDLPPSRCVLTAMATILDVPEIRAQVHRWTVAEFRALAEDNPDFAHSELILEKEVKTWLHEKLTNRIANYLRRETRGRWWVRQESSLHLADSMPEPDVAVVAGTDDDYDGRKPRTAALVVEVAVTSLAAVGRRQRSTPRRAWASTGSCWPGRRGWRCAASRRGAFTGTGASTGAGRPLIPLL